MPYTNPNHAAENDIAELRKEVEAMRISVQELTDAWKAAKGFLGFIKWTAGLGSALAIIWAALHGQNPH